LKRLDNRTAFLIYQGTAKNGEQKVSNKRSPTLKHQVIKKKRNHKTIERVLRKLNNTSIKRLPGLRVLPSSS
jgi:hypothetical protein